MINYRIITYNRHPATVTLPYHQSLWPLLFWESKKAPPFSRSNQCVDRTSFTKVLKSSSTSTTTTRWENGRFKIVQASSFSKNKKDPLSSLLPLVVWISIQILSHNSLMMPISVILISISAHNLPCRRSRSLAGKVSPTLTALFRLGKVIVSYPWQQLIFIIFRRLLL